MKKLVKEKLDENVGEWEMTEVTAAGTVTRSQKSIQPGEGTIYHDEDEVNETIRVKETLNETKEESKEDEKNRLRESWKKWNNDPKRHQEDRIPWNEYYDEHKK